MGVSFRSGLRGGAAATLALMIALAPAIAEARAGSGSSFGSRGSRTFSAPPATSTAPRTAAPIERSFTPNAGPSVNSGLQRPAAASGGFLSGGFARGLMGGFIGAGLFGLLAGHGFMGGFGGGMSLIGLLLQIGLIVLVARWLFNRFAGRRPSFAGFGGGMARTVEPVPQPSPGFGSGPLQGGAPVGEALALKGEDFDAFEKLLAQVQTAFGAEDQARLRMLTTAEMGSYFAEQIAENVRSGVQNKLSDIRLVKGDLSEAWRERGSDLATVAMRFALLDVTVDRTTGRVVSGDANRPEEVTEVWTFVRPAGTSPADWRLSAIQQA